MDAKLTENVIFVRGTGKDFVLQFIKFDIYIHTNHIRCVIHALCLEMIEKTKCKDQQVQMYYAMLPSNGI